ncbi:MAG: hypothetical protein ACXVBH_08710 [Flavisolibacter sp.]
MAKLLNGSSTIKPCARHGQRKPAICFFNQLQQHKFKENRNGSNRNSPAF